jgi:predicted ArsR family transcriptional regulator
MCKTLTAMDLPGPSGDALAQPARRRVFALLVELKREASTDELAQRLGLHPNGVRRHLEQLQEAGLVDRRKERGGRGRPGDRWLLAPDAHPGGERPSSYEDLAGWLARAIPTGRGRLGEIERAGQKIGRELAPEDHRDLLESFRQTFTALGFQPRLELKADGHFACCLGNCPYLASVRENADVVCTLHRGITIGLLSELDPHAKLMRFEPRDPERAGCVVEVAGGWSPERTVG